MLVYMVYFSCLVFIYNLYQDLKSKAMLRVYSLTDKWKDKQN